MLEFSALPKRIRDKIRYSEAGCWEWTAALSTQGYGHVFWQGRVQESHRVVYSVLVDSIPDGLVLDHLCHTSACRKRGKECPHRRCQNPAHVRVVSQGINALRSDSPPALNAIKDACDNGHEYTPETVIIDGEARRCKLCRRDTDKRRRPRGVPRKGVKRTAGREFRSIGTPERAARNAEIIRLRETGLSQKAIAAGMGLTPGTVSAVCWRHDRAA